MTGASDSGGVAIIGIAGRFPGAADHRAFWRNLCQGIEAITVLSDDELLAAGVSAGSLRDPSYVKAAPLLADCDQFDTAFFEYSPQEARLMDPQQRLLLEAAWEAFEDAGYRPGDSSGPVGVYVATGGVVSSYLVNRLSFSSELPGYTGGVAHIGNDKDFPSTRISYKLNLTGPSINVQTACSSSLVATHLACQAILSGECSMALAGGATVRIPQHTGYMSVRGGILSPDGHCRAFDANAQGTIFGSGVGLVLLKELSGAIADRDNIYAVIRGSAVNNDGARKVSYTASSVAAQSKAMVEAMVVAGVSPDQIGYVECHGTGTLVGDPLEIDALTKAFRTGTNRRAFCAIGSVKTNIGHLEQTAGVAALIKAALTLKHGKIPPSLHFERPNPKIDFDDSPFFVNAGFRDWEQEAPRVAAVNSLGLGGTNVFVVLEEARLPEVCAQIHEAPLLPFPFSGKTYSALRASMERHHSWIDQSPGMSAQDLSFTLTSGRTHFPIRSCIFASSLRELQGAIADDLATTEDGVEKSETRRLALLFSGQGSQYAGMGRELYRSHSVFRATIDRCAEALRDSLPRPLLEVLFGEGDASPLIHETAFTQPALFAVQAALTDLWRSWGVVPDVVLGHSVGEFAAAYCAEVYTLEDCLKLVAERARLMQALPPRGTMASIFAAEATVAKVIGNHNAKSVAIAAVNAPQNTVISGDRDLVVAIMENFKSAGVRSQRLTVSHAFHSPLIQPAIDAFAAVAASIPSSAPKIAWVSTTTGVSVTGPIDAQYWYDHGLNAVRFADGMKALSERGVTDLMELGPGGTLLAIGQQCVQARTWLGSLDNRRGDWTGLMTSLGQLYRRGYEIDWDGFNRPNRSRRISLPTYPFERQRFWLDDRTAGSSPRSSRSRDGSPAGEHLRSPLAESQFEASYGLKLLPYLGDHRIYGRPVLPMTVAIAAICDAARRHFGTDEVALDNLQYRDALVLPETGERIVQTILTPVDGTTAECRLASIDAEMKEGWRTHVVCLAQKEWIARTEEGLTSLELSGIKRRCATSISVDRYYSTLRQLGLEYGPSFRGIEALYRGEHEVLAHVVMPEELAESTSDLHPALVDACLHTYTALVEPDLDFDPAASRQHCCYLPIDFERVDSRRRGAREVWVHSVRRPNPEGADGRFTIDLAIYADDGAHIAEIRGLSLKLIPPDVFGARPEPGKIDWLYQLTWTKIPALSDQSEMRGDKPAGWLILADRDGVGAKLAEMLRQRGDPCRVVFADDPVDGSGDRSWRNAIDFSKAWQDLVAQTAVESEGRMRGVVNFWALDSPTMGMTVDQLELAQRVVLGSTLSLLRAVVEPSQALSATPRIWLVTRNVVSISPDDSPSDPASAALWGFGRSAALEHPQIWGGLLDLGARTSSSEEAASLLGEMLQGHGEDQVASRNGLRFAPRLVRAPLPPNTRAHLGGKGAYLITGGLGALGIETARWLVSRRGVTHLVLASRRGDLDPNAGLVASELAALGAEVRIVSADITKESDVRRLFEQIAELPWELRGIFHCAGVLDDGILLQMSWEKLWRVMAPKVIGGWLLSELSRAYSLECFVVFSSILSLTGSAGQSNYSAANAFLDSLVARRRAQGLPALALNFGPWAESGLATVSGEKGRQIWRARGTEYIPSTLGVEALDAAVGSDVSHAVITITKWPMFLEQFAKAPSLYDELRKEAAPDVRAERLSLDRATLRLRLKEATPAQRRDILTAFVLEQAMKTLGITNPIDTERPLAELGLDSLMSVTLLNRLEVPLGVKMSAAKLIQGPSVRQLAEDLSAEWTPDADETRHEVKLAPASGGSWLIVAQPRPHPRFRLFCFPFAGGGSAIYRTWPESLDTAIEVVAIEPPGRLGRIEERPISDVNEFVDKLVFEMKGLLDRPFAFFGHCLGGLTMYETARRLINSSDHRPCHLFVSGARPPDQIENSGPFEERLTRDLMNLAEFRINVPPFAQPDDVFSEVIRHFNIQATDQLLDNPELRSIMLPVIRAEFRMASNYVYESEPPWDIPITCFAAQDDPYVSRRHALAWGYFTDARLQVHIREGAHFAVVDDAAFIQSVINNELLRR